ncbi:phage gp6-like head-tail connector protein [Kosakonia sp. CFBP8986]|uniref:phage gp6-like head-tail connector protein n=1 Tax=Kosakonia sp. CFBP8986 TaxID=3096524 RepID=UPI002A6B462B|nr:phage gp6-like head-tail connector protein [Kosakonia sp. CFBP8986]MDY0886286.1 phage gp6-like head-tail connector protein [Kosakonia sp. CFBP8986]
MNERELTLIKVLGEEFGLVLDGMREGFRKSLEEQRQAFDVKLTHLEELIADIKSAEPPDLSAMVRDAVSQLPEPELPQLPDIASMVSNAVAAIPPAQDGKSLTPDDVAPMLQQMVDRAVSAMPVPRDGKDYDPDMLHHAVKAAVDDAVAAIPVPQDGKSLTPEDVGPLLQQMVDRAVSAMPVPRDGKDYDPDMLHQAVKAAVDDAVAAIPIPQDGRSLTADDVQPMLQALVTESMPVLPDVKALVSEAVAALPVPEPARDGEDGRDALALELLPFIDEGKSYPRGSYATHNGGLWRAYEKTHGMRGWECVVDGVAGVDIERSDQRRFTLTVNRASGGSETKSFDVPVMIYQGVFKSGQDYLPGDTVTWGGSLWHCDEPTQDKPGETGSKGWTLATKRGRDGRDKT